MHGATIKIKDIFIFILFFLILILHLFLRKIRMYQGIVFKIFSSSVGLSWGGGGGVECF